MSKGPLKLRELLKRLRPYGVETFASKRGKGSEIILVLPNSPNSTQGPQYPVKDHGKGTEIQVPIINAILRRFNIDPNEFWE